MSAAENTQTVTLPTGRPLNCLVCGHDQFQPSRRKLNTTGLTLFNLDWANKGADCYTCQHCAHIHWFRPA